MAGLAILGGPYFALSWPGGTWQDTAKYAGAIVITYVVVLWVAGLIWVYRDIRDRSRDPFYHAIAVFMVLAFNLPGLWLYLILRPKLTLADAYERTLEEEALLQELEDQKGCPTCHRRVLDDYIVCPSCTTQLKEPCPKCGKPLSYSWVACPYCATVRRARTRPDSTETALVARQEQTTPRKTGAGRAAALASDDLDDDIDPVRPAPATTP
jgi:hypothetical protein